MNLKTSETMQNPATAHAVAALLRNVIDYAGLFPPASLTMSAALANYARYSRSESSWILGRFIIPVARLGEFEKALAEEYAQVPARPPAAASAETKSVWALSLLPGADISADLVRIREFNDRFAASHSGITVSAQSLEVKVASPEDIDRFSTIIPRDFETYFEIPSPGNERECIAAVARSNRRAKIRTGGETADKFPAPENLIEFMRLCAEASVPFKATAGLHHPLRSTHPFTYRPGSPSGVMHGFLNVFLAAAFLRAGLWSC